MEMQIGGLVATCLPKISKSGISDLASVQTRSESTETRKLIGAKAADCCVGLDKHKQGQAMHKRVSSVRH